MQTGSWVAVGHFVLLGGMSGLFAFGVKTDQWPGYGLALVLSLAAVWLHRLVRAKIEILKILELKQRRLETKAWYFEAVITNSGNIIFTTDTDHRILKFNRGSEHTFGCSQAEVVGTEVQSLFEHPEEVNELLRRVEATGSAEAAELKVKSTGDENEVWLSVSVKRMLKREEEVIGEVFNCSNVTKRRQLERQLQEKNEQLLRISITDALTGLYNVRHLNAELGRLMKAQKRFPDRPLTIVLIDIDHFKEYNDTKGHQAGDQLLVTLSHIFNAELRSDMDTAYRYGGDEFVLVLPDTKAGGGHAICERILNLYRKHALEPTSLSIGISQYASNIEVYDNPLKEFIRQADEAMYSVKESGGDDILTYSPKVPAK